MKRYLPPILALNVIATAALVYLIVNVAPSSYAVEGAFFLLLGITIAGWGAIGIYFLRKKWGRKDSPRFVMRAALKDGLILGAGVVVVLVLEILGELTVITGLATLGLAIVAERLL